MAIKSDGKQPLTYQQLADLHYATIAELEAELAPWREMARQVEELQAQEPTSFEIRISWDRTEPDCVYLYVERETEMPSYWRTVAEGEGMTLPAAVNDAYERVKGVGDEATG